MSALLGFKKVSDLIGQTDFSVKSDLVNYASSFIEQDKQLCQNKQLITGFTELSYAGASHYFFFNKGLIYEGDQPLHIIAQWIELDKTSAYRDMIKLFAADSKYAPALCKNSLSTRHYSLNTSYPDHVLSKRQAQCLFYLLRGKSASAIANILKLSPRTVEYYMAELKNKMGCSSKAELIEKAIHLGYLTIIPNQDCIL